MPGAVTVRRSHLLPNSLFVIRTLIAVRFSFKFHSAVVYEQQMEVCAKVGT